MKYLKPNIQLFAAASGTSAGGGSAKKEEATQPPTIAGADGKPTGAESTPPSTDDVLPKTQEELDALIEKRLKREQKKWAKQQTTVPAQPPAPAPATAPPAVDNTELQKTQRDLLEARAELTAVKSGLNPAVAEDAVLLAVHEVEKTGDDLDDDSVADALKAVLKRHPEWKAAKDGTGFRVGAGGGDAQQATTDMLNEAFGLTK
jgi:hypothetical protein